MIINYDLILDVIINSLIPLTRKSVENGNKIFGAAIIKKSDYSVEIIGTNNENINPIFHVEISKLANQATIGRFIESLIARSSLIIAIYRKRDSALCEKHAHHALLEALSQKDGARAEELMQSHLVDLVSALDLREKVSNPTKLKDVLGGLGA